MREAMEPIFYAAGVDIALLGHLHALLSCLVVCTTADAPSWL